MSSIIEEYKALRTRITELDSKIAKCQQEQTEYARDGLDTMAALKARQIEHCQRLRLDLEHETQELAEQTMEAIRELKRKQSLSEVA